MFHGRVHGRKGFAERRVQGSDRAVTVRHRMQNLLADPHLDHTLCKGFAAVALANLGLVVQDLEERGIAFGLAQQQQRHGGLGALERETARVRGLDLVQRLHFGALADLYAQLFGLG